MSEALCAGTDTELFFDRYENDIETAKYIDRQCMSCPVMKKCFDEGVKTESSGVWGGIFLNEGRLDNVRNSHKTQEIWKRITFLIAEGEDVKL